MRQALFTVSLCLVLACSCSAQSDPNAPATKEDIQRFFDAMHTKDMIHQMANVMSKPMHQMSHEQCEKDKDKLPPDCEQRMNEMMDTMFADMPWNDMVDAMIPAYEKHFTKSDIDSLVAFYSSPTGQKLVREIPAVTAEAMQDMMPIMRKYIDTMTARAQAQMAEMMKSTTPKTESPN